MLRNIVLGSIALICVVLIAHANPLQWKVKAGLQVTTNDIPSSLFLDGTYLDKSPFINKKILPKEYILRIVPDQAGLAPYELPLTLHKGTVTVVTWKPAGSVEKSGGVIYEMEKLNNSHDVQLALHTVPDEAIITVDNGSKEFSPLVLNTLSEGDHQLEISLPSYETQQHSVRLVKGHKITVTVILGKREETLVQEASDSADVAPIVPTTGPQVQILPTNFFFNNAEVLRVREEASPVGKELGFAPVGTSYPFLEETTGWFQIEFEGKPGWVSAQFSQKITPETSPATR